MPRSSSTCNSGTVAPGIASVGRAGVVVGASGAAWPDMDANGAWPEPAASALRRCRFSCLAGVSCAHAKAPAPSPGRRRPKPHELIWARGFERVVLVADQCLKLRQALANRTGLVAAGRGGAARP